MEKANLEPRISWTPQIQRHARILEGLGLSHAEIAATLKCHSQTVRKYLGPQETSTPLKFNDLLDLFERFDAERNLAEALTARSGSVEQARLRASLRAHKAAIGDTSEPESKLENEGTSDDAICANLERLVGRKFTITD